MLCHLGNVVRVACAAPEVPAGKYAKEGSITGTRSTAVPTTPRPTQTDDKHLL